MVCYSCLYTSTVPSRLHALREIRVCVCVCNRRGGKNYSLSPQGVKFSGQSGWKSVPFYWLLPVKYSHLLSHRNRIPLWLILLQHWHLKDLPLTSCYSLDASWQPANKVQARPCRARQNPLLWLFPHILLWRFVHQHAVFFFFSMSTSLPSRLAHTRKVGFCERLCSWSSSRTWNHQHSQHLCPASCFHFLPLSSEFGCFTKFTCFYKDMTRCTHKCDHTHTHTHPFFSLLVFYNLLIGSSINQHPQNT